MQTDSQQRYQQHLESDYWKQISTAVKARFGYRCAVCNSPHDLNAHHRTYDHRGRELEFIDDLICLCRRCHEIFHGKTESAAPHTQPSAKEQMILITSENYKRLRCSKEPWHWMNNVGINPRKAGWAKRAIGHTVPLRFLK